MLLVTIFSTRESGPLLRSTNPSINSAVVDRLFCFAGIGRQLYELHSLRPLPGQSFLSTGPPFAFIAIWKQEGDRTKHGQDD